MTIFIKEVLTHEQQFDAGFRYSLDALAIQSVAKTLDCILNDKDRAVLIEGLGEVEDFESVCTRGVPEEFEKHSKLDPLVLLPRGGLALRVDVLKDVLASLLLGNDAFEEGNASIPAFHPIGPEFQKGVPEVPGL